MPAVVINSDDTVRRANEAALAASAELRAERQKKLDLRRLAQEVVRAINDDALEISGRICALERAVFDETLAKLRT